MMNNGPPFFTPQLSNITVEIGSTLNYFLPSVTDPDNDLYYLSAITLGSALSFTTFDNATNKLTFTPLQNDAGITFSIILTLTDNN